MTGFSANDNGKSITRHVALDLRLVVGGDDLKENVVVSATELCSTVSLCPTYRLLAVLADSKRKRRAKPPPQSKRLV